MSEVVLYMSKSVDGFITGPNDGTERTFESASRWHSDHHDGVPIFVLTHHVAEGDVPEQRTAASPTSPNAPRGRGWWRRVSER